MATETEQVYDSGFTLTNWRTEIADRCIALGWDVPAICEMEGYRLFQLSKLLFEAEVKLGRRPLQRGTLGHALLNAETETFFGTGLTPEQIRKQAEALPAHSAFDQVYVEPLRRERKRQEEERAAAERAAAMQADKKKSTLTELGEYGYR